MYLPFDFSQISREIITWKCIYLLISARFLEKWLLGNVSTFWFQPDLLRNWSPCCKHERTEEQKQTQVQWKENCCFDCRGPHLPLTNVKFWSKCSSTANISQIPGCPSQWNTVHEGAGDLSLSLVRLSPLQDNFCQTIPLKCKYCPVTSPLSDHTSQMQVLPSYFASVRPYLSNASTAQLL